MVKLQLLALLPYDEGTTGTSTSLYARIVRNLTTGI